MPRTTHAGVPSRAAALLVATTFAAAGTWSLGAPSASATPGDPHKVWVCKYVHKPGADEVLKGGKNPIHVDAASLTNDRGVAPALGDTFSDGQFLSVVVSLDDEAPATECPTTQQREATGTSARPGTATIPTPTATVTTGPAPTAPGSDPVVAGGATAPRSTPAIDPAPPVVADAAVAEAPATVAFAPVPALGEGAPDTGGMGQVADRTSPLDIVIGVGALALAGGVLALRTRRRRRDTVEVD